MNQVLNTLFITNQGTYLHLESDTVRVELERETKLKVPLLHLGSIVCFGNVSLSPALIGRCAADGRSVVLLDRNGRFSARIEGPVSGNVLLRRAQHAALSDELRTGEIARGFVAGKIQNSRHTLLRSARDSDDPQAAGVLRAAATLIGGSMAYVRQAESIDQLRGYEGDAARMYFGVFTWMVRADREMFGFNGRNRRPPLDRMNSLLSFLYTLLRADCAAALEGVGLDPQVGYLHALRPGRPALALDLMEELRPVVADRLALTLVNRKQLSADDFQERPGGSILLRDDARKTVITAYQNRKQEEVTHQFLGRRIPVGLIPHIQARLLARHLRGDLEHYPPFLSK